MVNESYIAHNSGSQKQMFGRRCLWLESDLFLVAETNRMICPHFVLDSNVRTILLSYGNKRFHKVFYLLPQYRSTNTAVVVEKAEARVTTITSVIVSP